MEAKKDFEIGDLVWAKMKYYQYWPAKIVKPPPDLKPAPPKKVHHYVFFLGSENYAWIPDENILHHSDEMLQTAFNKKKQSASFKLAVKKINEESQLAPKKTKSPLKKTSPKESSEGSKSSTKKKITKLPKTSEKNPTSKRRFHDESANKTSPRKITKMNQDYSELISNTPPNIGYKRVAAIGPSAQADHTNSPCSSGITRPGYSKLMPVPTLDLQKPNEAVLAKNIRSTLKNIGFIGLGMMGQRLVKNLLTSGHNVTVWNRTLEKCGDFVKLGAQLAQTPGDVVEKCDIIFCCVSGPDASKSLVFGACGILSGLAKSLPGAKGYIEMTSIDPTTSQEIADAITHKGGRYLEAPISGSRQMAENGALLILAAGDRTLFNKCESCFFALSDHAYFLSCDVGCGSKMNLILSMLFGISHAALAEAMALIERSLLNPALFLEILEVFKSNLLSEKAQAMAHRRFETNVSIKHQRKDLNLALSLGNMIKQPMLLTTAANELFKNEKLLPYYDHDISVVFMGARY